MQTRLAKTVEQPIYMMQLVKHHRTCCLTTSGDSSAFHATPRVTQTRWPTYSMMKIWEFLAGTGQFMTITR